MRGPLTPSPYLRHSIVMPVDCPHVSSLISFTADASLVCGRAKHHYDPQHRPDLFAYDNESEPTDALSISERFRQAFRPTHERMEKLMYFC